MRPLRVLHCPTMTGGNPQSLARAERRLGLDSWSVTFLDPYFQYPRDEVLWTQDERQWRRELKRWRLLLRAARDFHLIHFNFGSTIMPDPIAASLLRGRPEIGWRARAFMHYSNLLALRDLPLLKRLGKGIVVTYQGDDARQGDFCLRNFAISAAPEVEPGYHSHASDQVKRRAIATFARHADRMYALNPDLLHVLPSRAEFLPYASVDLEEWRPAARERSTAGVPLLVHAPTHRGVKGTRFILDAVARLKQDGIPLEFVLVENLSNAEARQIFERADLLVDQLLVGWYGALAVELMALGKPVVCYLRESDLDFIPAEMRQDLPILQATPATLHDVLRDWLTVRKAELVQVGERGRRYVEKWHDPLKIAAALKHEYEAIMESQGPREAGRMASGDASDGAAVSQER